MSRRAIGTAIAIAMLGVGTAVGITKVGGFWGTRTAAGDMTQPVALPAPRTDGPLSLERALFARRSVRSFLPEPISVADLGQLLWAAQGVTDPPSRRTAPSAGATYPLVVGTVADRVDGLAAGVYRYDAGFHALAPVVNGHFREELADAALDQSAVREAAAVVVVSAIYGRTTSKYGPRGERYVHMEAGHAVQNLCLQAVVLDLGAVPIGAFDDDRVRALLGLRDEAPLYLVPVGIPVP